MTSGSNEGFVAALHALGTRGQLRALADSGATFPRLPVNAHVHLPPNFTAFQTTQQALDLADAQGVAVLGASNYYDYSIYQDFGNKASEKGIFPLFGLEIIALIDDLVASGVKINDPGNPGKMYLCGKGITRFAPMPPVAHELLQVIRDNDSQRLDIVTERLAMLFKSAGIDTGLTPDAIKDRVAERHGVAHETVYLQERHLAQAFQETLFEAVPDDLRASALVSLFGVPSKNQNDAVTVQNEIRSHLMKAGKAAFVSDTFVDFDHAYQLILALGGIPSYPVLVDGTAPICQYEASSDALIAGLKARGISAAEFIPVRNTPEVSMQYVLAMRAAGLFVTAGTEHNTLELLPIEPTCLNGAPIPDAVNEIFWEGACVVAAHQYLSLMGEPGFVSDAGVLHSGYASNDERIREFARLGAAVISKYREARRQ